MNVTRQIVTQAVDPDAVIRRMWELCDGGDGITWDISSDQWFLVKASCEHREFRAVSRGSVDLSTAFVSVLEQFEQAHA